MPICLRGSHGTSWGIFLSIQSVLETLDQAGCGYTIDSFKFGPHGQRAIQWVVARPTAFGESDSWPPLEGQLEDLPKQHQLDLGLSNSNAQLPNCPFQPNICSGSHLVATGVGTVA
jgi:hypothetical protein